MYRALMVSIALLLYSVDGWCQSGSAPALAGEPFVYTEWESFTTESTHGGLVNDHIFFLKADGDSLWIGTEGGLVLYHDGTWQSWTVADGLPWNVIMGIAKDPKTGDLWRRPHRETLRRHCRARQVVAPVFRRKFQAVGPVFGVPTATV